VIKFLNPLLMGLLKTIPYLPGILVLSCLWLILAVDISMTVGALLKIKSQNHAMSEIAEGLNQASRSLQAAIVRLVDRRMNRAFPGMEQKKAETEEEKQELIRQKTIFAYGCSFYKVVWIFFLGEGRGMESVSWGKMPDWASHRIYTLRISDGAAFAGEQQVLE